MENYFFLTKNKEQLLRILQVKPYDITYPYCSNCFKRVHNLGNKKKWLCSSCNEEYGSVKYRYKLVLDVCDGESSKQLVCFGVQLEQIFGATAEEFNNYIAELKSITYDEDEFDQINLMQNAFNHCLIGRWFSFEFKPKIMNSRDKPQSIVSGFRIPQCTNENFVSIYKFLKSESLNRNQLNFSNSLESIIDSTLNESSMQDISTGTDDYLATTIKMLKLRNGILDNKSPFAQAKCALQSTPISNSTRRISSLKL